MKLINLKQKLKNVLIFIKYWMNLVIEDFKKKIQIENGMYLDVPKILLIWLLRDKKKWKKRKLNFKMK